MRHTIQKTIQDVSADRAMTILVLAVLAGGIAYITYVGFNVRPSDLQLAVRYTSFGETHFYREKWWYLLSFIGFGGLFLVAHIGMMVKLYGTGMKQLAYALGWLSLMVLLLAFVYTYSVLSIAYLN